MKLNSEIIYRKIGDQRILVPVGANVDSVRNIFTLNESAAFILDAIEAQKEVDDIYQDFEETYEVESSNQAMEIVDSAITEFRQNNIVL